jgi:hypothetical protein
MRWVESHVYHEEVQERLQEGLCSRHGKVFLRLASAGEHCPTDNDSGVQCVPSHYLVSSLQMELDIAFLARATGDDTTERYFTMAANARRLAIQTILWNEDESQWFDYWLPVNNSKLQSVNSQRVVYDMDSGHLNLQIFASNFIPLWCGVLAPGQCSPPSHISCRGTSMVLQLNSALQLFHGWYYSRRQCQQLGCHI